MTLQQPPMGCFADPEHAVPGNDPRIDPRLMEAMKSFGLAGHPPARPLDPATASADAFAECLRGLDKTFESLYLAFTASLTAEDGLGVEHTLEHTTNPTDGAKIELHVHRPAGVTGPLPAAVYFHGGGMTLLAPYNDQHRRWTHGLARQGLVAINVGFRNAGTEAPPGSPTKYLQYPTPLDDSVAALQYIHANRTKLGISKIVATGESGGGNLSIASTLKLRRNGHKDVVDGVYLMAPFVSGAYQESAESQARQGLGSLVENSNYYISAWLLGILATAYDPERKHSADPLAWPLYATDSEFHGFPPTVISVDELDPLRDEGMQLARKMARAGVHITSRMNLGMLHATEIWKSFCPDMYAMTVSDIKRFADSLA